MAGAGRQRLLLFAASALALALWPAAAEEEVVSEAEAVRIEEDGPKDAPSEEVAPKAEAERLEEDGSKDEPHERAPEAEAPVRIEEDRPKECSFGAEEDPFWHGDLDSMSTRRVAALSVERVVMCYSRRGEGSGCRAGRPEALLETPSGTQKLRRVPWGDTTIFEAGEVDRLELERLAPERFAVCYRRVADGTVACSHGELRQGEELALKVFSHPLELCKGRLVSLTSGYAGQRFNICAVEESQDGVPPRAGEGVTCKWGEMEEPAAPGAAEAAPLRWSEAEAPRRLEL